jgi:N-acetylglucosaminyldiphosphoundecaprenol N-acetyl-beta-D-mannosaminyltransferase
LSQPAPTAQSAFILKTRVDLVDVGSASRLIADWTKDGVGRMVCAVNVHMIMEACDDSSFQAVVNGADLVVADGRPVAWACRLLGHSDGAHVRGEDLTLALCEVAWRERLKVGLYGGTPETLDAVRNVFGKRGVDVTYACSPPFRTLTPSEDAAHLAAIRAAGVQLLLVGLGCPKQERWMAKHRVELPCIMVGVGAVFEMLAGRYQSAPAWLQRAGLEWAYRLAQEPRRLWRRYALHNSRFVIRFARQWLAHLRQPTPAASVGELVAYEAAAMTREAPSVANGAPATDPVEQVAP